jgi:hypothetical protein
MKPVSLGSRWLAAIAVGLASVVAQIVAPSLLVTGYAMVTRDGGQIVAFALRVAEAVALLAAILTTVVGAHWAVQRRLAVRDSGTVIGAVSYRRDVLSGAAWRGFPDGSSPISS